jgi:hypothetical protein
MKNLVLGVIFSLFVTVSATASVSSGLNLPGGKKKKCESTESKDCKSGGKEKKCCSSKGDSKDSPKETK